MESTFASRIAAAKAIKAEIREGSAYATFKVITFNLAKQYHDGLLTTEEFEYYWTLALVEYNTNWPKEATQ